MRTLSQAEQIEYYLGKDKFKDRYFKPEIPNPYTIIPSERAKEYESYSSSTRNINAFYPNLEFQFNNLCYRSDFDFDVDELNTKRVILCLGCSDTFGLHVNYQSAWPSLLAGKLEDYTVLNLGVIGSCPDTVTRLLVKVASALTSIDSVCLLWPHYGGREFVSKEYTGIVTNHNLLDVPYENYWDFIDWKSDNYNLFKNYHLAKSICDSKNIRLFDLHINRFDKKVPYDYSSPHYALGRESYQAISNYFYKKILNKDSLYNEIKNVSNS
jgi:hypothetical protein